MRLNEAETLPWLAEEEAGGPWPQPAHQLPHHNMQMDDTFQTRNRMAEHYELQVH